ncbi:MAG: DMT family transporter [Candidatus Micrarchaeia archaeon]|jgi:drug/metabolite transporter (DMT)-like permease
MAIEISQKKGIALALAAAFISGLSVFINSVGVAGQDPFAYTILKNAFAGVLFAAALLLLGNYKDVFALSKKQFAKLSLITIVGGSVPFLMFFYGLSILGGPAGSFIYRFLFVFAAIFAAVALKEKLDSKFAAGAGLAIIGNFILLGSGNLSFGIGEAMVLGATMLWAIEWTLTKKFLAEIPGKVIATSRMLAGSIAMVAILAAIGKTGSISAALSFTPAAFLWGAAVGTLLFLYLNAWYSALLRISVSKATAILALAGPVTTLLGFAFAGSTVAVTFNTAFGMVLLSAGALLIAGYSEVLAAVAEYVPKSLNSLLSLPSKAVAKWKE